MPALADLIQQGATHWWLFVPTAILLGALHGLEPGHSKTMMASFIVAVRGTVAQAVVLGLCAALSHSIVVWVLALVALRYGNTLIAEQTEPYFMIFSGFLVISVAVWMFLRTRRDNLAAGAHDHHDHDHDHDHDHEHDEYQDAHERAHAREIQQRFAGRHVTTAQIAVFGLTGGLLPCPASVTILMLCLHLKRFTLGLAMVASFSAGLALAMVSVGVVAAWGARHADKHFGGLGAVARRMPYLSSALMTIVGLVMSLQGFLHLPA